MSDFSQGEGWWQASDGKWYPPETAPPGFAAPAPTPMAVPMAAPTPAKSGLGTGPIVAIVVAVVLVIGAIAFFVTSGDGDKKNVAATQSSSSSTRSSSSSRSSSSTSSSSSGAPDVVAPPGFKVFKNDGDGFALALPERFEVIDVSSGDIDQAIDQLAADNPQLAGMAEQIKSVFKSGGKLVAINPVSSNGFNDNLNIIAAPGAGDVTSLTVRDQIRQQIESSGATNIGFEDQRVHGRSVLTASYEITVNSPDGTPTVVFGRQAYIPAGGRLWIMTLSTGADAAETFVDIVVSFDVNE